MFHKIRLTFDILYFVIRNYIEQEYHFYSKYSLKFLFKSWTRLIAFHIALIPLGKV